MRRDIIGTFGSVVYYCIYNKRPPLAPPARWADNWIACDENGRVVATSGARGCPSLPNDTAEAIRRRAIDIVSRDTGRPIRRSELAPQVRRAAERRGWLGSALSAAAGVVYAYGRELDVFSVSSEEALSVSPDDWGLFSLAEHLIGNDTVPPSVRRAAEFWATCAATESAARIAADAVGTVFRGGTSDE